ncbi:MAG: hypothetical protein OHK0046_38830 [Anaerolineae bacterium]
MSDKKLEFLEFDPDSAKEKLFQDAILMQLESFKEKNPDDPPPPDDMIRQQLVMLSESPFYKAHVFFAYNAQGTLVGGITIGFGLPDSPDYAKQKHIGVVAPFVIPDYRRQGIGTEMLRYATRYLQSNGKTLMQGSTEQDGGRAFAHRLGAQVGLDKRENRLDVKDIDWEMVEAWERAGAAANPNVNIELFKGLPDDADMEAYSMLYTRVFNQQPLDNSEGLEVTWTPELIRQVYEREAKMDTTNYVMVSHESDGTLSGLTEMTHNPKRGHRIAQGLTGVHEDHRGRGLGKWLKAKMLLYMRENFSGVEVVSTQNAMSNAAMNSINERLGFKQHKHDSTFKIDVDELSKKLGT